MVKVYPDRAWPAFLRVVGDLSAVIWSVGWAVLGWLIYKTVMGLEVIAGGIPYLTQFLLDTANALQKYSGDPLVEAGHNIHDAIFKLAIVLALLVVVPPILLVLLPYGTWRWRDMHEIGAALAFVRIASVTGRADQARAVLAFRAVTTLSFRQLMSASS